MIQNNVVRTVKFAQLGTIFLCLAWALFYSMKLALDVPTLHIDGAFQTASSLFRLDAGQLPGRDFFPYLGIGPIILIFPFFKIFGSHLAASGMAAQFVTLMVTIFSISFLWQLIWRPKSFLTSLTIGSLLLIVPLAVAQFLSFKLSGWFVFATSPGNSLRPVRALAPYLLMGIYYFCLLDIRNERIKYILSGILTAGILLWSNDYAIPSAGLFVLFIGIDSLRSKTLNVSNTLAYCVALIISWIVLFNLATNGHVLEMLRYNFIDVAHDQFWFFSPYSEDRRIFSLQQFYKLFSHDNLLPCIVLILTVILAFRTRLFEHVVLCWIGIVLFAGAVLASVGGHIASYFSAFYFWGAMTIIVFAIRLVWLGIDKWIPLKLPKPINLNALVFLPLVIIAMITVNTVRQWRVDLQKAEANPNLFYVSELGGYLGNDWKDYINLIRQTDSIKVLEEYWGLWSATKKVVSAWPVDSVISALGSTREIAEHKMPDADIIISTRYNTSRWQPWNLSQNYWFYEELIEHWTPHEMSPTTVVWRKNDGRRNYKTVGCIVDENARSVIIDAPVVGFYDLEMRYTFNATGRSLLMIRNNVSFGSDAGGYVSLNPKGSIVKLPVYMPQAGSNNLDIKVVGSSDYVLKLSGCVARQIIFNYDEIMHTPPTAEEQFFKTDDVWNRGIARNDAGFFLPSTENFISKYKVGKLVRFSDGETRRILRTKVNAEYLNVYVEGAPLDSEKVGYPTTFVVVDDTSQNIGDSK